MRTTLGTALALLLGAAAVAAAEEVKAPISATMFLSITAPPPTAASRTSAFDAALKEPGPPAVKEYEVLPDGSVRYGKTVISVKNPCPPGTDHYEPPPLPGRRARR